MPIQIDNADLMGMWSIVVEAARLDCQNDRARRVVGLIEHADGSVQFATVPEADAAMKPGFFGGWLVTPDGGVHDLPVSAPQ